MDTFTQEIHYKVLKYLEQHPDISQRKLADEMGVSLGKVNYCLKALIDKGFIKAHNFKNNTNKASYLYLLTPKGIEAKSIISINFLKRKMDEYEELKLEISELQKEVKKNGYL